MSENSNTRPMPTPSGDVEHHLAYLKLAFMAQHYAELATQAAPKMWPPVDYLARLVEGEADVRRDRATKSRIRLARFPVLKTVDQFRWDWPTRLNRLQGPTHFHRAFLQDQANLILLGGGGLGQPPRATALGSAACRKGHAVLFASAIDVMHTLAAARSAGRLQQALKPSPKPARRILDARGSLPIDKAGADLLFQVISLRYEQGALILTSNRAFQAWPKIFKNDSTLTAAILDRLLPHADTVIIEGKSFRMQDQLER